MIFVLVAHLGCKFRHCLLEGSRIRPGITNNIWKFWVREPHRLEVERPGKLDHTYILKAQFNWAVIWMSFCQVVNRCFRKGSIPIITKTLSNLSWTKWDIGRWLDQVYRGSENPISIILQLFRQSWSRRALWILTAFPLNLSSPMSTSLKSLATIHGIECRLATNSNFSHSNRLSTYWGLA